MTAQETLDNVEKALDEIRPFLMSDGGNIKLLSIEDAVVKVQLACPDASNIVNPEWGTYFEPTLLNSTA